jgi:hypothetical protein
MSVECVICFDEFHQSVVPRLPCTQNHNPMCITCLGTMFATQITDGNLPLRCPEMLCQAVVPYDQVCKILELTGKLDAKNMLEELLGQEKYPDEPVLQVSGLCTAERFTSPDYLKDVAIALDTDYFHYLCCGELDRGWGCAYRCAQMIVSHCLKRGLINKDSLPFIDPEFSAKFEAVPSINSIQRALVSVKALPEDSIGSRTWIEPSHVSKYMELLGLEGKYEECKLQDAEVKDEETRKNLYLELQAHYSQHRSPVMIDDAVKSYIIVGSAVHVSTGELYVLLFDPHVHVTKTQDFSSEDKGIGVKWTLADQLFQGKRWMLYFLFPGKKI